MKFLFSDSLDFVDPSYDFGQDRNLAGRRAHEDDQFPHEHLDLAPYDGILISRAIVGDATRTGKYSQAQCMRFSREGARRFLRYPVEKYPNSMIMGDCGAFTYRNLRVPPYSVEDTLEFYEDCGFTHGCSVDHVILHFNEKLIKPEPEMRRRYDLTLENARVFLRKSKRLNGFTPIGVIQGWSPKSLGSAALQLSKMGYRYLAVGGLVPLRIRQITAALEAIRDAIPPHVQLHLLGFGKTTDLGLLLSHNVQSFDTTSPLLRAFKDGERNYYALRDDGELDYYTAVRIPQALDNTKLLRRAKRGRIDQDRLLEMETAALNSVRTYGKNGCTLSEAVRSIISYGRYALWNDREDDEYNERRLQKFKTAYTRTLKDRPWERCTCRVCRELGVEALVFRSSNRNKRRGIHNLHVFYTSVCASDARSL
jgi:hypothetical protein